MVWYDYYISPTGVTDPDSGWNSEANAIDGVLNTYAVSNDVTVGNWTEFLYFSSAAFDGDGFRFSADPSIPFNSRNRVDIDLYYDDAWNNLYEGSWALDGVSLSGHAYSIDPNQTVTQARIRFKATGSQTINMRLGFVMFHKVAPLLFGISGDQHFSDNVDHDWPNFGQKEYRRVTTAPTRFGAFIETVDENIDPIFGFSIHMGDAVDSRCSSGGMPGKLAELNSIVDDSDVPFLNIIGNHDKWEIDSRGDMTWAEYFAALSNHATQANGFPDGANPKGYTFDVGGFRCIVLYYPYLDYVQGPEGDDQQAWLTARLSETSKPVIIFSHAYLHTQMHQYGDPSYAYYGGDDTYLAPVRTIIENSGKVIAVFQSHYHRAKSNATINEIPYVGVACPVHAPLIDDNAYYIVEVTPNVFQGPNQMHGTVKLTGYGSMAFDYNGDKFSLMSA